MAKKQERVESPLLRHYVLKLPRVPSYVPHTSTWVWVLILVLLALLAAPLAVAAWFAFPWLVQKLYPPSTADQKAESEFLGSIGRLRRSASQGILRKTVPPTVLEALESCASTRAAALTELASEHISPDSPEGARVERCMRAAVTAALPVIRLDQHSRKEWEAICENRTLTGKIVDSIRRQEERISGSLELSIGSAERLEALRELDALGPSSVYLGSLLD